jgi:hypothetical protein
MPVDMLISRFLRELQAAVPEPFVREGASDPVIRDGQLPPYRHIFHALCLFEHSSGYRLPRYERFRRTYLRALENHPRYHPQSDLLFPNGTPAPGLLHRIGGWYLDGLAHTHLYCVLVQAYEEQRRVGAVLMDARADAKLKADVVIVTPRTSVRIDIRYRKGPSQRMLLARRANVEADAKAQNSSSSQIDNPFFEHVTAVSISRDEMTAVTPSNIKLFSGDAIDRLLVEIDTYLGLTNDDSIKYVTMARLQMTDLQRMMRNGDIRSY